MVSGLGGRQGGGPPKFVGKSHDVEENKGRKKLIPRKSHDVRENKGVSYFSTISMKTKVVRRSLGQKRVIQVWNSVHENEGTD
jgi:hypothetical protein